METWGQHVTLDSSLFSERTCLLVFTAPLADQIVFLQHDHTHTHYSHAHSIIFLTSTRQPGFTFPSLTDSYVRNAPLPQRYSLAFRSNERHCPPFQHTPPFPVLFFISALAHTPYCDVISGGRHPDCMAPWRHLENWAKYRAF